MTEPDGWTYSDDSGLSDEERELVRRARADNERLHANRAERRWTMPPEKTAFPIGINPDGTVNRVPGGTGADSDTGDTSDTDGTDGTDGTHGES